MAKIKRKTSKRKSKTRRNCIPCNPSMRGIYRINPEPDVFFKTKGRVGEKTAKTYAVNVINKKDFLDLFYGEDREDIEEIIDEMDFTYGDTDLSLVRMDTLFSLYPYMLNKIKPFGITSGTYLNL